MSLIKNIFKILIFTVLLILIFNYYYMRTNIIWDNMIQGYTTAGITPYTGLFSSNNIADLSNKIAVHESQGSRQLPTIEQFVGKSINTGLVIPNKTFPSVLTSNFMFSIWFFIDDYTTGLSKEKYISSIISKDGINYVPHLIIFLTPYNNNLGISIATMNDNGQQKMNFYYIENIPLQKWNCLIISVIDRTMDIYLEGKLVNSFILNGYVGWEFKPEMYIGHNTQYIGGYITRARIDNGGINPQEAYSIYKEGINTSYMGDFINRYRLKVGLYEYNDKVSGFTI